MSRLSGYDLLWNWARWTWSGATVGNMEAYVSWEDDPRPIFHDHALVVEAMHAALPWHERMVIIAEYPQKNAKFGGLDPKGRRKAARPWIANSTGSSKRSSFRRCVCTCFRSGWERTSRWVADSCSPSYPATTVFSASTTRRAARSRTIQSGLAWCSGSGSIFSVKRSAKLPPSI